MDEWLCICQVDAMEQVPIMLVLRWTSRAIVSVVKAYLLIFSRWFWLVQKNTPTSIRQNFAKIFIRTIK